jgi:hypothetical protein
VRPGLSVDEILSKKIEYALPLKWAAESARKHFTIAFTPGDTKTTVRLRAAEAYEHYETLLASSGLRSVKRSKRAPFERDATWYVRTCVLGEKETGIHFDLEYSGDLSTIKKAIDRFAAVADLPSRPKQPFLNPPKRQTHRKQA